MYPDPNISVDIHWGSSEQESHCTALSQRVLHIQQAKDRQIDIER